MLEVRWPSRHGKEVIRHMERFEDEHLAVLEARKLLEAGHSVAVIDGDVERAPYAFCSTHGCAAIAATRIMRQVAGWPTVRYVCPMCDGRGDDHA